MGSMEAGDMERVKRYCLIGQVAGVQETERNEFSQEARGHRWQEMATGGGRI